MSFKKVVVAGGGVLVTQIAFQAAYCGFDVTIWLRIESSIRRTKPKIEFIKNDFLAAIKEIKNKTGAWCMGIASREDFNPDECVVKTETAYQNLKIELDMKKVFFGADNVSRFFYAPLIFLYHG